MSGLESRRTVGVVLLAALVVLAGCSGGAGGGGGAESQVVDAEATAVGGGDGGAAPAEADAGGSGGDALQVRQRQVIRTGEVALQVENFDRARRNLTAAARDLNGFVSDSSRRRHEIRGGTYVTGSLTLRVPQERFDAMMDRAEGAGTVQSSNVRSRDVTDQLVDIEARLGNLRAQRERLRTLYEQANDTEAVLQVQQRLSETQERIERLEARQRSLERQVAYSTVRVELREERPEPGPEEIEQWYDVPLVGAFLESVHGVTVVARAAAVLAAYALPYLLAFGAPPVLIGAVAFRRWRDRLPGGDGGDGGASGDGPPDTGDGGAPSDESTGDEPASDGADDGPDDAADGEDDDAADGTTGVTDGTGETADDAGDADADGEPATDPADEDGNDR